MLKTTVIFFCLHFLFTQSLECKNKNNLPIVITTWSFINSTKAAFHILKSGGSALDAIERGASVCEEEQCYGTVGYGGSPDEEGETTLSSLIMDGRTMNLGAVAGIRRIKSAISVARHVMEHTKHSILAGELATKFAVEMGFTEESLTTDESKQIWQKWLEKDNCQPNFWKNVTPDPTKSCGPYKPTDRRNNGAMPLRKIDRYNHDTIGMVAIDKDGNVAAGTSTNGANHKIPGRVGDSPIPGSGAYADNSVGAAVATGDGDVMLRFLPTFVAVEEMRRGATPIAAAQTALQRIASFYPKFMGALLVLRKDGQFGVACHGMGDELFPFVFQDNTVHKHTLIEIKCS